MPTYLHHNLRLNNKFPSGQKAHLEKWHVWAPDRPKKSINPVYQTILYNVKTSLPILYNENHMLCAPSHPQSLLQVPSQLLGTPACIEHHQAHIIRQIQSNPFGHLPTFKPLLHHDCTNQNPKSCIACQEINLIQSGHMGRHGHQTSRINQTITRTRNSKSTSTSISIFQ